MLTTEQRTSLLKLLPPGQVFTDPASLIAYQVDAGGDKGTPDAVVTPSSTGQVQRLAAWAAQQGVPLIARGSGTGLTGGSVAHQGGVVVSFSRMNEILAIDPAGRQATVQPGVITATLHHSLAPFGLAYPPDPASQSVCTLGGNIAENAGGPHCLKYGVTGNYINSLEVVLAGGQLIRLGGETLDPPEYDLVGLLTGSEGTLGMVTEAVVRLRRLPEAVTTLTAIFTSIEQAGRAVSAVIEDRILPATIELMDGEMLAIVAAYMQTSPPPGAGAMLIFDIDGYPESLDAQIEEIRAVLQRFQPIEMRAASTAAERELLWLGRRNAGGAISLISPNEYPLDVTLPRSRLGEGLAAINAIAAAHGFRTAILGHAGDGNIHPSLLCDLARPGEAQRVQRAGGEILALCARMGGSIGGEHGIGIEKRDYLPAMYAPVELAAMLEVRQVFDPQYLLNPGKIFPPDFQPPPRAEAGGQTPAQTFIPTSPQEAADGLRALQAAGKPTYITGGGSHWQGQAASLEHSPFTALSTTGLRGITHLSTDDLYVSALGGTPTRELQAELAGRGFRVAIGDSPAAATIGGVIACAANAPLRLLYGSLRDQLLACEAALPDGRVLHFGRPLVKDVAGYAMSKIMGGAFGTLGLLCEVTLKIWPLPAARRSLIIPTAGLAEAVRLAGTALESAVISSGLVVTQNLHGQALVYTAEGHPAEVQAELGRVRRSLAAAGADQVDELPSWDAGQAWSQASALEGFAVRIGLPTARLAQALPQLDATLSGCPLAIDAAHGLIAARLPANSPQAAGKWLTRLREVTVPLGGYAVIERGPRLWLGQIDAWGPPRSAAQIMQKLKSTWDPAGILNPGEFPARIPLES